MKSKVIFKIASILCLIAFYITIFTGVFVLMQGVARIWKPDSNLTKSFGPFKPLFSYIDIDFHQLPALYQDTTFLVLYFAYLMTTIITALLFLWFMYKLLKNIHVNSLFMYENVSILLKLGVTIGILGSASTYTQNLILSKVLGVLNAVNAQIAFSNLFYMDMILGGIVLIFIALALKLAVNAVEENKKTI